MIPSAKKLMMPRSSPSASCRSRLPKMAGVTYSSSSEPATTNRACRSVSTSTLGLISSAAFIMNRELLHIPYFAAVFVFLSFLDFIFMTMPFSTCELWAAGSNSRLKNL